MSVRRGEEYSSAVNTREAGKLEFDVERPENIGSKFYNMSWQAYENEIWRSEMEKKDDIIMAPLSIPKRSRMSSMWKF